MTPLWSDDYLNQLVADAHLDIIDKVSCIFYRFYLAVQSDTSVYTLPDIVIGIKRITWRGIKLEPVSWGEMQVLTLQSAVVSPTVKFESSSGRPQFYALHPTNLHNIQFYPRPSETFTDSGGDPYSPSVYEPRCTISCFRLPLLDSSLYDLPKYIAKRTIKAYVAWKAFAQEGKGQDLTASGYYFKKYQFLISQFQSINNSVFMAKRYQLGADIELDLGRQRRPAKPTLPSNFERTIYR